MIQRDYLIVGGGVGGASACDSLRQFDQKGSVTLVSNEAYVPYQRPPLSKSVLRDSHVSIEKLVEKTEDWYKKKGIELRLGTLVRELNIDRRLAVLENGQTIEFRKACIATGSRPRRPLVAGANLGNVVYLRGYRDSLAIREILLSEKHVVVVGSGFLAESRSSYLARSAGPGNCTVADGPVPAVRDPITAQRESQRIRGQNGHQKYSNQERTAIPRRACYCCHRDRTEPATGNQHTFEQP
jgi:pyruvate/2-oxoglutarate dehydrogenase complex dihydrolipoamide dehydrogenase (E3) component